MDYIFSDKLKNLEGNAIREIFKLLSQPGIISFAGGLPAGLALPKGEIKEILNELLSQESAVSLLQYGATAGYAPFLNEGIKYAERFGIKDIAEDEIMAISGGQQGIDLTLKAFINKGDVMLVEEPTYLAVLHILKSYEGVAVGVKSDENGIDLADLEAKIKKHNPKVFYLVPTFANPTGNTLSTENRKEIARITAKYGVILLEDNPYAELRFKGEHLPAIKSYDTAGNVIYLASFSKIISPGMRVGLAVADKKVIAKMVIGKQATDVHTALLSQATVAKYLEKNLLNPALEKNIPMYKEKFYAMLSAIEKHFPPYAKYTRPDGGLFIWVTLPDSFDTSKLFKRAVERKVAFVPGESFYANGNTKNTFRLNFSNATLQQIEDGIKILSEVIKEYD
ncbi:MAG: PLP-dependent aminotransferase family protein [Firmicutes bacterium]|nr:PLP-dependent aminotransferase family protein [Bacillota bacterium]